MVITLILLGKNELASKHLERFIAWNCKWSDNLLFIDDHSDDETWNYLKNRGMDVHKSDGSGFNNEIKKREAAYRLAQIRYPKSDWFFFLDADELILSGRSQLEDLLLSAESIKADAIEFLLCNLWESEDTIRVDAGFGNVRKIQSWKANMEPNFKGGFGLHQNAFPVDIKRVLRQNKIQILHFGFASRSYIQDKYLMYKNNGQNGYALNRIISSAEQTEKLETRKQNLGSNFDEWFSQRIVSGKRPNVALMSEILWNERLLGNQGEAPVKVSIICLVYKGIEWVDFAFSQILEMQSEFAPGEVEIIICGNDAEPGVLDFLKQNGIKFYDFRNIDSNEYYINRVYRAYNYAASKARGEYLLFINSDMYFPKGFLSNLYASRNSNKFIAARLVESGSLRPSPPSLRKNFGKSLLTFRSRNFENYAKAKLRPGVHRGGLYMPSLIHQMKFLDLGGFPEGNVTPSSLAGYINGNAPEIWSRIGEPIPGDRAFALRAERNGVEHVTLLDCIAYHFQEGEKRHSRKIQGSRIPTRMLFINDSLQGINGEDVLWGRLALKLKELSLGIDHRKGTLSLLIRDLLSWRAKPRLVFQNASYVWPGLKALRRISLYQDSLSSKKFKALQKLTLMTSELVITNSIELMRQNLRKNFTWMLLPTTRMFWDTPLAPKTPNLRPKIIFVGAFNATKGWSEIKSIVSKYREVDFVLVSKYSDDLSGLETDTGQNFKILRNLQQTDLIPIYDSCDAFILGSPFETQCLAALEACSRDIPIIMKNTGMFSEHPERDQFGWFNPQIEVALKEFLLAFAAGKILKPRQSLEKWKLDPVSIENEWLSMVERELQASFKAETRISAKNIFFELQAQLFNNFSILKRKLGLGDYKVVTKVD